MDLLRKSNSFRNFLKKTSWKCFRKYLLLFIIIAEIRILSSFHLHHFQNKFNLIPIIMSEEVNKEQNISGETSFENADSSQAANQQDKKKRLFSKELRCMMYGFGDDQNPYTETVDMLEDIVIEFISDITLRGLEIGRSGKVTV